MPKIQDLYYGINDAMSCTYIRSRSSVSSSISRGTRCSWVSSVSWGARRSAGANLSLCDTIIMSYHLAGASTMESL